MTTQEFQHIIKEDIDAIAYFEQLRWGERVKCAYCGTEKVSQRQVDMRYHCSQCRRTFSVTTGTRMHNSKLPLKVWMQALAVASDLTKKIPVKQLQMETGTSYSTAWYVNRDIKTMIEEELQNGKPENLFEALCKRAISKQKD